MDRGQNNSPIGISPARLVAFSDGIFAIAITLLVFNLRVPPLPPTGDHRLAQAMILILPNLLTYIVTFLLIAVFWFIHHQMFSHIERVDNIFIWLNIGYLLAISFLPFPTAVLSAYPYESLSLFFYIGNMIFVGSMLMAMWAYACRRRRLVEKNTSGATIRVYMIRGAVSQFFFVIALVVSFFKVSWGEYCLFTLVPTQLLLIRQLTRRGAI